MGISSKARPSSGDLTVTDAGVYTLADGGVQANDVEVAQGSVLIGNASGVGVALDASGDTKILVGNGTTATSVAVSGDATLANTGALTIAAGAVESSMLDDALLRYASVALSNAQIKALATTPRVLVTGVASNVLVFERGILQHNVGTADFATSHNLIVKYKTAGGGDSASSTVADGFISGGVSDQWSTFEPLAVKEATVADIVAQDLVLTSSANPITGDGVGVFHVWYRVVPAA